MIQKIVSICLLIITANIAAASSPAPTPIVSPSAQTKAPAKQQAPAKPASQLNTNIYEKESTLEVFSAVANVVREVQGEFQVFFQGRQGFYSLKDEAQQHKLVKSIEQKKAVSVEVDKDSRQILSVEFKE